MKLTIALSLVAALTLTACGGGSNTKADAGASAATAKRYTPTTVGSDVILADSKTGLSWTNSENGCNPLMDTSVSDAEAAKTAQQFCDGMTFGGKSDWRLPTVAEMTELEVQTDKEGVSLYYKNPVCKRVLAVGAGGKLTSITTTNMSPVGRDIGMELPAGTRCVR